MNDYSTSSLAGARSLGAGIVSWGDYAEGYSAVGGSMEVVAPARVSKFAVWKDMAEEPWKYGDDIGDWLVLDDELRVSSGRWRIGAFWEKEQRRLNWEYLRALLQKAWVEYTTRKARMATRIQALWRGHAVRQRMVWRDCCMCLAHHVSPIKTEVGFMCRKCSEDGPYVDLIGMDDPWEWFRAERG